MVLLRGSIPLLTSCSPIRRLSRKRAAQRTLVGVPAAHDAHDPGIGGQVRLTRGGEGRSARPFGEIVGTLNRGRHALLELRFLQRREMSI